jgi:hypothetical protein
MLFSFQNGVFNIDDFFKVVEWGFGFTITISKTLTLLDFITGGVGGGLNAVGKYIGLDSISITIAFTIGLDIVKRAATANRPETGSMTITLGITFTVSLVLDIFIAKFGLIGTLEIVVTLLQDLVAPTPLRVFLMIQLTISVVVGFLFWDWTFDFHWSPNNYEPPMGKELTSNSPEDAAAAGALGGDFDGDGLSNEYENARPGMNPNSVDSDGDGLDDKLETQTLGTDPAKADTDADGLTDSEEINVVKTDPLNPDTDYDGLNDYDEAILLATDPLRMDTDQDGLTDYYEANHKYNMTGITPSVTEVIIGGISYPDRTDPLVPDTDGDGLLDGEEDTRGIYYGPDLYWPGDEDTEGYAGDTPPLSFNGGYTHPLDNDTDDDSYWQLYDGSIAPVEIPFIIDMTDRREIEGRIVIFIDPLTGIPEEPRLVRTNPVNPDTDGDTGAKPEDRENPPFGFFLNSDGYELSRDPPTDPLDGDTDDDGLIDGLEGILRPDSNHTDALNPDTDGDGLGDMQEIELGTDGRSIDTDRDGITDGDEFFKFHTNPFLKDSDFDGVEDGEEVYTFHSNPLLVDSDGDGLSDYEEIWKYFSNPMDEDSDNDFLTDWEEIILYYTDPFSADSDDDGLFDGEEIQGYNWTNPITGEIMLIQTDPNNPDSDNDSIMTLDQDGEISQRMNDYDEFLLGTNPNQRDSDLDGVQDAWELWVGKGKIPDFTPLIMDPLNNDTDGDTLWDGQEFVVANVTTLLNEYVAFVPFFPYGTRPDRNDTDGDFLSDSFEVRMGFNATSNDTDADGIDDYDEWNIWGTDVNNNDTDGDGILDRYEVKGFMYNVTDGTAMDVNNTLSLPQYPGFEDDPNNALNPLESDTDGDLLPDGSEIFRYHKDPSNPDENNNDVLDGMELDSDNDGIPDGAEFYIYKTQESPYGGGIDNPDSDGDGLFDGLEAYTLNTDPSNFDTDNDTYSDGLEYFCGTDLLSNSTTAAEIEACMAPYINIIILSPAQKIYHTNSIPVIVWDRSGNMTSMEYRWREANGTDWSSSVAMAEDPDTVNYWRGVYLDLPEESGDYVLQVTAADGDGKTYTQEVTFTLDINLGGLKILSPKAQTYSFQEWEDPKLPIKVEAGIDFVDVKYRIFKSNGDLLKPNTTLVKNQDGTIFQHGAETFPSEDGTKTYIIEVFGEKESGEVILLSNTFKIKLPTVAENLVLVAAPIAAVSVAAIAVQKGVFKNPFKKKN